MAKVELARANFVVARHGDSWVLERGGEVLQTCGTKEEALAAANKLARASQDSGTPCMVTVFGEQGNFALV